MSRLSSLSSTLNSGSTPTKDGMDEVLSIITPEMKKNLFTAADDDEDSGIGMELKKLPDDMPVPRFSALCSDNPSQSLTPDICFQIHRPRRRVKNSLFSSKRPCDEENSPSPKFQRCDDSSFKRSFSFGDEPCYKESSLKAIRPSLCRLSENSPMGGIPGGIQTTENRLNKENLMETSFDNKCCEVSPMSGIQNTTRTAESRLFEDSPMCGIQSAVTRLSECRDLIADGSRTYCLPTVQGQHPDLKSILSQTMSGLLNGEYDHVIDSYNVIDCRYPYEYIGGHIMGAGNCYTHESILELLSSQTTPHVGDKRHILVFHCEFSSERAPKLCRFLRQKDREQNKEHYPALNYPEVYILHGGYKAFFENHKELCDPIGYTPMLHSDHSADLRHFRIKSKSWTAGEKRRYAMKTLRF